MRCDRLAEGGTAEKDGMRLPAVGLVGVRGGRDGIEKPASISVAGEGW